MRSVLAVVAAMIVASPAVAQEPVRVELPSSLATLELDGQSSPLPMSPGIGGPLFLLEPLVQKLGGQLVVGPTEESHSLRLADAEVLFGPGSATMTVGREVVVLSQPPLLTESGLRVPIDLLRHSYGDLQGLQFRWDSQARVLEAGRRAAREIGVELQIVHISGITTVVVQFDQTPSYSVSDRGRFVEIEVPIDRLRLTRQPQKPRQSLLDGISMNDHVIRLELEPGVQAAEPYVLSRSPGRTSGRGLRLVIDLSHGSRTSTAAEPVLPAPGRFPARGGLRTIVLDPGHGGSEDGAIGPAGSAEKDLTLILAKALARKLEERLPVRVLLTRQDDDDLPLEARTSLANQNQADLFISLHLNASPARSAHGAETYFLAKRASDERAQQVAESENLAAGGGATLTQAEDDLQLLLWDLAQSQHLAESQRLARLVQEELNAALGLTNRGVRQAPFVVLMGASMPAVLIELGFITNSREEQQLLDPAYRAELLDAVVAAVSRFQAELADGSERAALSRR